MIGKDEEVELPELDKILTKYMTGESKRPLWPYLTEALQKCLIPLRRRRRRSASFNKGLVYFPIAASLYLDTFALLYLMRDHVHSPDV